MFESIIKEIADVLRKNKIPVILIGGHAANVYGEIRYTKDIDFMLGVGLEGLEEVLRILPKAKLVPVPPNPFESALQNNYLRCVYGNNQMIVDVMFSSSEYERTLLGRAIPKLYDRMKIFVASKEDIIILKAQADRARDWDDIRGILLRNPDTDLSYIKRWLSRMDGERETDHLEKFKEVVKTLS